MITKEAGKESRADVQEIWCCTHSNWLAAVIRLFSCRIVQQDDKRDQQLTKKYRLWYKSKQTVSEDK